MPEYRIRDIFYQNIREEGMVPTQDLVLIKIIKEKNIYRVRGVKDNLLYDYPKQYLDVFLRLKYPYGS